MPRRCDHTAPARSKEARTVVGRLSPGGAVADGGIGGQSLSGVAIYMEAEETERIPKPRCAK
jgi:hypothetical protein